MTSFSKTDPGVRKPSLGVLFSVIVVDLIGFGIVVPILPFWAERFGMLVDRFGIPWLINCEGSEEPAGL